MAVELILYLPANHSISFVQYVRQFDVPGSRRHPTSKVKHICLIVLGTESTVQRSSSVGRAWHASDAAGLLKLPERQSVNDRNPPPRDTFLCRVVDTIPRDFLCTNKKSSRTSCARTLIDNRAHPTCRAPAALHVLPTLIRPSPFAGLATTGDFHNGARTETKARRSHLLPRRQPATIAAPTAEPPTRPQPLSEQPTRRTGRRR